MEEQVEAMRLPDEIIECVAFIGVTLPGAEETKYGGTGFFVAVPSGTVPQSYVYFVTAKHCIVEAEKYGTPLIRMNLRDGSSEHIAVKGGWLFHDDSSVDLAVLPLAPNADHFRYRYLDHTVIGNTAKLEEHEIGIGDNLAVSGLFTRRVGKKQNIPIVRFGNIAAMPSEPLPDSKFGLGFHAYLAEVRSIGGLSGSPVFAVLEPGRIKPSDKSLNFSTRYIILIGVVRGHWEHEENSISANNAFGDDLRHINAGIATVTPATYLHEIIFGEDLLTRRKKKDEDLVKNPAPVFDSALGKVEETLHRVDAPEV